MPSEPWREIEAWIAKATAVIRNDWPEQLDEFKAFAKREQPIGMPRAFSRGPGGSLIPSSMNADSDRIEATQSFAASKKAHFAILSFLDGLLQLVSDDAKELVSVVPSKVANPANVFVVHGRNDDVRRAMFAFLRSAGLQPLEWSTIVAACGGGSPYVGEILKAGFSMAQATVVLFTPDDEARLRPQYQEDHEPSHEKDLTPQPRPNVLFEAGMAIGMQEHRTVIVEVGRCRPMSDILGRHTVRMDGSSEKRLDLLNRLRAAGCPASTVGADWLKEGDFAASLAAVNTPEKPAASNFVSRPGRAPGHF